LFTSISDRNQGEALTTRSISRIVKQIFRGVGLDSRRLTAHSLRHTAITLSIKGGASLQQAQAMARHTDPKTTMIYFHNLNRLQAGAERFIQI
jgi:integrase/recombinase XerC/integrase/recombinase XerD